MRNGALRRIAPVLLLALLSAATARAQLRDWQAYPSLRQVQALAASGEAVWAVTDGGLFSYAPASGEVTRYTPVEGLHSVEVTRVAADDARGAVWVGYMDGVLDRLDPATGAVTSFFDIARAEQYSDRSVRRIRVRGDSLLVATAFGLVVFDTVRGEVRDTYARLGPLEAGTPVNDALVAPLPDGSGPALWLATSEGVVYAPLHSPNLQQPSAWTLDPGAPRPAGCLTIYAGAVHACAAQGAQRRVGEGNWAPVFGTGVPARDLLVVGDHLYAPLQSQVFQLDAASGVQTRYRLPGYELMTSIAFGPDGAIWVGDHDRGILSFTPLTPPPAPARP
jgi:hypothetical protein